MLSCGGEGLTWRPTRYEHHLVASQACCFENFIGRYGVYVPVNDWDIRVGLMVPTARLSISTQTRTLYPAFSRPRSRPIAPENKDIVFIIALQLVLPRGPALAVEATVLYGLGHVLLLNALAAS